MDIARSIIGGANKLVSAINPIRLFQQQAWRNMGTAYHKQMAQASDPLKTIQGLVSSGYQIAKKNYGRAMTNYHSSDENIARSFADYMAGHKIGMKRGSLAPGQLKFNSIARKTALYGLGAYSASSYLFGDNPVNSTVDNAAKIGMHATVGSLLWKANKTLGGVYTGMGMVNILRGGLSNSSHVGPF